MVAQEALVREAWRKMKAVPPVRGNHDRRGARGFTLIELIITLVILGVLVAMGVPAYTQFVRDSRRSAVLNEFSAALNLARSEAIKRGVPIAVCRTSDGLTCGGSWNGGWLVFVNTDNDVPAAVDSGELVLRTYLVQDPAYTFTPNGNFTNFISYLPNGSSNNFGRFTYCDARGLRSARAVLISVTGRARLSRDANGDGIDEDDSGANLVCS